MYLLIYNYALILLKFQILYGAMRTDDETSQLCINETVAESLKFIGPTGAHISRINEIVQVSS